jgi:energy-coupling factor transport system ATP-binding protein
VGLRLSLRSFAYPGDAELFGPLSLILRPGQAVALVGGSGSGKSSLLTVLAGLHPEPLGGRLDGEVSADEAGHPSRLLGYLGSDPEAFLTGFCATVMEEVGWTLLGWGWSPEQVEARVRQTLDQLGLPDLLWRDPRRLSGGQQQMVALAAVWARQPRYLLLDEPASRLDPRARQRLQSTVEKLVKESGAGLLWSTANLGEVRWCDAVWSLAPGGLEVACSELWDSESSQAVPPWPRQWAALWGGVPPVWTATELQATGPLPLPVPAPAAGKGASVLVQGLCYRPPRAEADLFAGLDWQVGQGECVGLVGVNGAGKTTLARLLRGLLRPRQGSIEVAGRALGKEAVSALAQTVAYTFQEPLNLFLRPRVDSELLYSGQLLGWERARAWRRAEQAMERFGLRDYAGHHPRELPAGIAALLGVALSWYTEAPLQILDEPLARLDRQGRRRLEQTIADWRAEGTTVLLIAHDLDWLATVCTSFAVLEGGSVLAEGPAEQVFARPEVRARLGTPLPLAFLSELPTSGD